MICILIPENMKFARIDVPTNDSAAATIEDHFVDARENIENDAKLAPISIQKAVYDFLSQRDTPACIGGLVLMRKHKPHTGEYLEYRPVRNGLDPTDYCKVTCKGTPPQIPYGSRWFQSNSIYLSPERLAVIKEKSHEQKLNRQHIGDSPCPT